MSLLDDLLPDHRFRQVHHAAVVADPDDAWDAIECLDPRAAGLEHLVPPSGGRPRAVPLLRTRRPSTSDPYAGFAEIAAQPGRERVAGAVARFWDPEVTWAHPSPETFGAFDDPGWGKLAWSLRVDPRVCGGAWLTLDVRAAATDAIAWRRFHRGWRAPVRLVSAIRRAVLDRLARELGPPAPRGLPGDELLCASCSERTRRRIVEVPPERLWPWVAGVTGDPAPTVGERIAAPTTGAGAFAVLRVEEGRSLVIGTPSLLDENRPDPTAPLRSTWAFSIEPVGEAASFLEVRVRTEYRSSLRGTLEGVARGVIDEVIERRQVRALKHLAEASTLH